MPQGLIFLELATTGSDSRRHDVWEIAYLRRRPERSDEEWVWQYRPESLADADPAMLRADRYYERMTCPAAGTAEAISAAAANAAESHNTQHRLGDRSRDDWVDLKRRLSGPVLASLLASQLDGAVIVTSDAVRTAGFLAAFLRTHGEIATWAAVESIASRVGGYRAAIGEPIIAGASATVALSALGLLDDPDRSVVPSARVALTRQAWDATSRAIEPEPTAPTPVDEPQEASAEPADDPDEGPAF